MVYLLLGPGFEESEAIVPLDLLRRAGVAVQTVGLTGKTILSAHQVPVVADCTMEEVIPEQAEMVILPGGLGGVAAIEACPPAMELIRSAANRGAFLCAICAGPTVLGKLGLLQGKKAVCYPGMEGALTGAAVPENTTALRHGNLITGQAAGAAFEFGLLLVEALKGAAAAEEVKHNVYYHS